MTSKLLSLTRKVIALLPYIGIVVTGHCVAAPVWIPSGSMEPTMHAGDLLTVNRLAYSLHLPGSPTAEVFRWDTPNRGEIIVFNAPLAASASESLYIKRVVAVAGDTLEVRNHLLTLNGQPVTYTANESPYLSESFRGRPHLIHAQPSDLQNFGPYQVPAGHVFVMGDNRDNSSDSRVWGALPLERIRGRASYRLVGINPNHLKLFGEL